MKKDDFIAAVAKESGMKQKEVETVIDAMVPVIVKTCVEVVDFIRSVCPSIFSFQTFYTSLSYKLSY